MCGRYTLTQPREAIATTFGLDSETLPDIAPRYNIAPSQPVAIIRAESQTLTPQLTHVVWGLIPFWAKDPKIGYKLINARGETVAEKPSFKAALKYRRCLIPADGFYEWQRRSSGKQPYYFQLRDRHLFAFAGLWEHWQSPDGSEIESCTIITTAANEVLRPVHDRMPVIIPPQHYNQWLDLENQKPQDVASLLQPYTAETMMSYPVHPQVNNARYDQADCIQPLDSDANEGVVQNI